MKRGISLVALVITIVVLLILTSAVVLTLIDTSIFDRAKEATEKHNMQEVHSAVQGVVLNMRTEDPRLRINADFGEELQERLNKKYPGSKAIVKHIMADNSLIVKYTLNNKGYDLALSEKFKLTIKERKNVEPIPAEEDYLGYYADVDGDEKPDGVIYADLMVGGKGLWNNDEWSNYEYQKVTEGLKEYYICSESYTGFGGNWTKPVLSVIDGSGEKDRFYVMALDDVNNGALYCWYNGAYGNLDKKEPETTNDFGEGRKNTIEMIKAWNDKKYGAQNTNEKYLDMWGVIQKKVGNIENPTWFVASKSEWSAFGDMAFTKMGLNNINYIEYGLMGSHWSSTQYAPYDAYMALYGGLWGYMDMPNASSNAYVRLSATF